MGWVKLVGRECGLRTRQLAGREGLCSSSRQGQCCAIPVPCCAVLPQPVELSRGRDPTELPASWGAHAAPRAVSAPLLLAARGAPGAPAPIRARSAHPQPPQSRGPGVVPFCCSFLPSWGCIRTVGRGRGEGWHCCASAQEMRRCSLGLRGAPGELC